MKIFASVAVGLLLSTSLLACSETTVLNTMGMGKSAPDETQVVTNHTLATPPDLRLPPPTSGPTSETQAAHAQSAPVSATPPDAFSAPATGNDTQVASTGQNGYDTGEQQLDTFGGSTNPPAPGAQPQPIVQSTAKTDLSGATTREDAYKKFGISKTRPDGTAKTQTELDRELLEAVRNEKRKQNPRYGTVFNIGELFKGD
jgi:hypothetical protein